MGRGAVEEGSSQVKSPFAAISSGLSTVARKGHRLAELNRKHPLRQLKSRIEQGKITPLESQHGNCFAGPIE
jgi:hypothetical protein